MICLPYAGGSSLIFSEWRQYLSSNIDIIPIDLNGRGYLSDKPFYMTTLEAAEDILLRLESHLEGLTPICFFGQSLGGLIIYDMISLLIRKGGPLPFHVFFSAIFPPHINKIHRKLHEIPDGSFIKHMKNWLGLPQVLTDNPEMVQKWTAILKADYRLLENYHFAPQETQMPIDLSIIKGKQDHWLTREEYLEWNRYSDREIQFHEINGGHLFIHEQKADILTIINNTISDYL